MSDQAIVSTQRAQALTASSKVLRNTYALLALTLLFSALTAALSMAVNAPYFGLLSLLPYFGLLYATEKIQYSLARVYEAQGQKLSAMRSYQQFLRKVPLADRLPGQTEDATGAIARLQKDLAHLLFSRALTAPLRIDDEVPTPKGSIDAWVEPGTHRLLLPHDIEQIKVAAGETRSIEVPAEAAPPITHTDVTSLPPKPTARPGLRTAKWTLGVTGLVALGVGGTLLGISGLRACANFPTSCNDPLQTKWPGVGLLVGGGVMVGISAVLLGVDAYRPDPQ